MSTVVFCGVKGKLCLARKLYKTVIFCYNAILHGEVMA